MSSIMISCLCCRQVYAPQSSIISSTFDLIIRVPWPVIDPCVENILLSPPQPLQTYLGKVLGTEVGNTLSGVGPLVLEHVLVRTFEAKARDVLVIGDSMLLALLAQRVLKTLAPGYDRVISEGENFLLMKTGS